MRKGRNMSDNLEQITDDNFKEKVIDSELPVLIDFWAPWCGPCRMITPMIEQLSSQYQGKLKVVKVNTDESPDTASKYNISAIPTLIILKDGEVMEQVMGVRSREELSELIEKHI